jgi:flavorubredoxin
MTAVDLSPAVTWISTCHDHGDRHEHVSVYLLDAPEGYVLVDSGSFHHREKIRRDVRAATDGAGIDAIVLSHSDYPHSANVDPLRREWENVEVVASSGAPAAQGLPESARKADIGGSLAVRGRTLRFLDPPLADRSHTTWILDPAGGTLFAADGMGSYHRPGECVATSADRSIPYASVLAFHRDTLPWLRYVDPETLEAVLAEMVTGESVERIAPIHGTPILAGDLDAYLEDLAAAAAEIADDYQVPDPVDRPLE